MIVGRAGRCPRCDVVHGAGARFCGSCGLDFTSAEAALLDERRRTQPPAAVGRPRGPSRSSAASIAKLAGLVWLIVGAVTVIGALGELSGSGRIGAWAAVSALLELVTGVALFLSPSWEMLTASMLWGILSVLGAVYATLFGTPPNSVGFVLVGGIAVATLLSWLGRRPLPVPEGLGGRRSRTPVEAGAEHPKDGDERVTVGRR